MASSGETMTIPDFAQFLKELEAEAPSTRKCLERITDEVFDFKPHEKSMGMGYLALLVADIPKWITAMVEIGEINFPCIVSKITFGFVNSTIHCN